MSKTTDKRRRRLKHARRDLEMISKALKSISNLKSGITPEYLRAELTKLRERIDIAEKQVDTPEGEDLVHGLDSAQAEVAISFVLPGMLSASGGRKTSSRALSTRQTVRKAVRLGKFKISNLRAS